MFGRGHSSGINVHVWINLDSGDFETGGLEEQTSTGCFEVSHALAVEMIPTNDTFTNTATSSAFVRDKEEFKAYEMTPPQTRMYLTILRRDYSRSRMKIGR